MQTLLLLVPRETARKLRRAANFTLDGSKTPWQVADVPGQRHPDKTTLSVYVTRTLMQRLRRLAAARGESVTAVVEAAVAKATRDVVLTPEDYEQIARETRRAAQRRTPSRKPAT